MQQIFAAAAMTLFPCLCTILGAGLVFFVGHGQSGLSRRVVLGLAAGIMLAGSVFNLLVPAMEQAKAQGPLGCVIPAGGLMAGGVLLLAAEWAAEGLMAQSAPHSGRILLGMALHDLPQGMVVGLTAAMGVLGHAQAAAGAALSLGIGLQNIPEGAAVSLPVLQAGASRKKAFAAGAASALVEPLGAVLAGALAGRLSPDLVPWLLAAAAGAMLCVAAQEMIPQAAGEGVAGLLALIGGFALMMALTTALE